MGDFEGDDLSGHRCADISAHNNTDGLGQIHQAGGDEPNNEHSGHR